MDLYVRERTFLLMLLLGHLSEVLPDADAEERDDSEGDREVRIPAGLLRELAEVLRSERRGSGGLFHHGVENGDDRLWNRRGYGSDGSRGGRGGRGSRRSHDGL